MPATTLVANTLTDVPSGNQIVVSGTLYNGEDGQYVYFWPQIPADTNATASMTIALVSGATRSVVDLTRVTLLFLRSGTYTTGVGGGGFTSDFSCLMKSRLQTYNDMLKKTRTS